MNPVLPAMPSSPDIPLHDIKPLVEVPDHSLLLLSVLVVLAAVLIGGIIFLVWRSFSGRKKVDLRKRNYKLLENITFDDPKKAAYAITRYGLMFAEDGERYKEAYGNLVSRLAPYKYKKNVAPIDEEAIAYYRIYIEMIDV
jgi:hypothetical protein